jgi:hypothetical protein
MDKRPEMRDQSAKADAGKARISLVPMQILKDIAEVREYGVQKYSDPDNWMRVELDRYIDAIGRHYIEFVRDPLSVDEESGIEHYKHIACNLAFVCEFLKDAEADDGEDFRAQHKEYLDAYQQKHCSKCDVHIAPKIECSRCGEMARPTNKKYNGDLCEVTYHCPSCGLDIISPDVCPKIAAWRWDDDSEWEDVLDTAEISEDDAFRDVFCTGCQDYAAPETLSHCQWCLSGEMHLLNVGKRGNHCEAEYICKDCEHIEKVPYRCARAEEFDSMG